MVGFRTRLPVHFDAMPNRVPLSETRFASTDHARDFRFPMPPSDDTNHPSERTAHTTVALSSHPTLPHPCGNARSGSAALAPH